MITADPLFFSVVRFTDFVPDPLLIPAMNRWAIFTRPLVRTQESLLFVQLYSNASETRIDG